MNEKESMNPLNKLTITGDSHSYVGDLSINTNDKLTFYTGGGTGKATQLLGIDSYSNYLDSNVVVSNSQSLDNKIMNLELNLANLESMLVCAKKEIASLRAKQNASKIKKRSIFKKTKK